MGDGEGGLASGDSLPSPTIPIPPPPPDLPTASSWTTCTT